MPDPKHTPGPWIAKLYEADKNGRSQWGVRQSPDAPSVSVHGEVLSCGFSICNIVEQDMDNVENGEECANAHLIAVVPEMVELFKTQTEFMASLIYTILSHELLRSVPAIKTLLDANKGLGAKCISILAKAKGGNDG